LFYFFLNASHKLLAFNEQLRRKGNPKGLLEQIRVIYWGLTPHFRNVTRPSPVLIVPSNGPIKLPVEYSPGQTDEAKARSVK
ncbi:MAG: hypothetical protein AAFZ52_04370, partial [Bacteroidota bacterium]